MSTETDSASTCALSTGDDSADLDSALAALRSRAPQPVPRRSARSSRRAALGLALSGLLVGGIFAAATAGQEPRPETAGAGPADDVYLSAHPGSCLVWQPDQPDRPSFVQCTTPHLFEVASAISEPGEPCSLSARKYLGARFDPNSKFSVAELSPGPSTQKHLCGLELAGPDGHPVPVKGQVAEADQSKLWPAGTCRGIDPKSDQPTDAVVDCAAPHSVEVVGAVDLGPHFHDETPSDADQLAALEDSCAQLASAYLTPRTVSSTGLSVIYHAIGPTSWAAGSRHAVCALGPKPPGPITGPAKSHHVVVQTPEPEWTPQRTSPEPGPAENAISNAGQNTPERAIGGADSIVQVPAGPDSPAHSIVSIPGLAPVTVPAMPEDPGAAPVPLIP